MKREEMREYIRTVYGAECEKPWIRYPEYWVFRHEENRKWFAVIMRLARGKLGEAKDGETDVLNVKCEPLLISSLQRQAGFHPAYHMDKNNWITVGLENDEETLKSLLNLSFEMTKSKKKQNAKAEKRSPERDGIGRGD